jgi:hypothetical protein
MTLAEIRALTLELLGDTAEGSSRWAVNGDSSNVDDAIQWAQEQVAIQLEGVFYFEASLPVIAQPVPPGMPVIPGAYGGVAVPDDNIKIIRVAID